MQLKRLPLFTLILAMAFPLLTFSGSANEKLAAGKPKPPLKKETQAALNGSWQSPEGSVLKFLSAAKLEFDGETFNYSLVPGAIRINEEGEIIDYYYTLKGNILVIDFPEGFRMHFQKMGQTSATKPAPKSNNSKAGCNVVHLPAEVTGGCNIRLVTPANCEEIDLAYGGYEFAWQTGGTFCETPYKLYIAGNPVTDDNMYYWSFSENTGKISRTQGGYHYITAEDLAGLKSDNGIYHWVVIGYYGSHPSSQTFRIKR